MQLVVGEQFDGTCKMLGQRLHGEVRAGMLTGAERVQSLLKRQPVQMLAPIGQQVIEHLGDAFRALGLLEFGAIADVSVDAHRVAYVLGLHDE
jgi:hypothetical protein